MVQNASTEIRVELARNLAIWVSGQDRPISFRGLGRVILYLVLLRGASASRSDMARTLWPEEPDEVSANRLRVSLSRIKKLLGTSLIATRTDIRLAGLLVSVDLWNDDHRLQSALDEVDSHQQLESLKAEAEVLRGVRWREVRDLDVTNALRNWEETCSASLRRMAILALDMSDWDSVDLAFELMLSRKELDLTIGQAYLTAHCARGNLDEEMGRVRRVIRSFETDEAVEFLELLAEHRRTLAKQVQIPEGLQSSHFELLGRALLKHSEQNAAVLAPLLAKTEVQLYMQSAPTLHMAILESVLQYLETRSQPWIELQIIRIATYGTVYNSDKVIETSEDLLRSELPPLKIAAVLMYYSFSLFHVRRWDDALSAIRQAQKLMVELEDEIRLGICRITEAAYLWHLDKTTEACRIYDSYLVRFKDSDDFVVGVNRAVTHFNYGVVQLGLGNYTEARKHVDLAYGDRYRFNLDRLMPNLLSLMAIIYGRTGEVDRGIELAIEGLKLTYPRGSSREGQINMEWTSGLLVLGGLRAEAWSIMEWVNEWRIETSHTRSVFEMRFCESLNLQEFEGQKSMFSGQDQYRQVLTFLIKCLRRVQQSGRQFP